MRTMLAWSQEASLDFTQYGVGLRGRTMILAYPSLGCFLGISLGVVLKIE